MTEPDQYSNLLYGLASAGIIGFVAYVIGQISKLKDKVHNLEIEMRDKYTENDDFNSLVKKVDKSLEILYELCGKLGVPIRRD